MPKKVTDPELLKKLGNAGSGTAGKKVTDPALLEKLHGDAYLHPDDFTDYVSEGLSGVNEGIADLMSLPAQGVNALLSAGPMIVNALGGNAKFPDYIPDPGERARGLMEDVGAIKPPGNSMPRRVVRRIGREVGRSLIPVGGVAARAAQPLRTLGGEMATVLGSGLGAGVANEIAPGNPLAEMTGQVLGGGAGGLAALGARKAVTPLGVPEARQAAVDTLRREGVDLTAGQKTGNRAMRYAEGELGGTTGEALMERQAQQFTRAALSRAGVTADRATPEVLKRAYDDIGGEFDDLAAQTTIVADRQLGQDLGSIQSEFNALTGKATRPRALEERISDIVAKVREGNGTIAGPTYKSMRSEIDRLQRHSSNPELKMALGDLRTALDDAVERSMDSAIANQWRDVRSRYRNLLVVTDAVSRAGESAAQGLVTPANLRSAVSLNVGRKGFATGRGDLNDLAHAGVTTMTPLPNSGTASRLAARGLTSGISGTIGAVLGNNALPGAGAVLGAVAGAGVPRVLGRAMLSRAGRTYLGNNVMSRSLDPRGVGLATSLAATANEENKRRLTLREYAQRSMDGAVSP